ncbi:hypothetical protein CCE01nite_25410 [Cellulomonas cellasea]|uniref:Uncharacterized protein n=1 Tax=Cellulomonas cellasea TaxID=43670 RepID=A0A4Y3KWU3_9CELL|nr:hypothetical protein CCE01nite_25410 [Cellulomonas cellasea]
MSARTSVSRISTPSTLPPAVAALRRPDNREDPDIACPVVHTPDPPPPGSQGRQDAEEPRPRPAR